MAQKTYAIFGGTFDPPHVGHVLAVHYILLTANAERVMVIPCAEHPFGKGQVDFAHRLAMCRLAFTELGQRVQVLDIEAQRQGTSYTIDTVHALRQQYPDVTLKLVVGSDIPAEIDQWKSSKELLQLVELLVLPRKGFTTQSMLPEVSSSDVRHRLTQGQEVTSLLPSSVLAYLHKNGLYKPL